MPVGLDGGASGHLRGLVDCRNETLASQRSAYAACRLPDVVGVAQVTEMKFVDCAAAESFHVTQVDELSETVREGIK